MAADLVTAEVGALLATIGRAEVRFDPAPIGTGGNNRVICAVADGERVVAKRYYHDAAETRDRMRAEFSFVEHAWRQGMRCVPRPIACDPASHIALYEFVEGRHLQPEELGDAQVVQAARFFARLNTAASRLAGRHLPAASDACFSTAEHIGSVDRRISKLSCISTRTAADREGAGFAGELAARWALERERILCETEDADAALPEHWRCLSPSDFGFHNALLRPAGAVSFLDFEYAGWDDPAKMIGDFFAHPGLPVPSQHYETFVTQACAPFEDAAALIERARHHQAIARVRWCCIMLNEFLPDVARRRQFADPSLDLEARKRQQLRRARRLIQSTVA
ncbi:MAG TPA: aminoglycoside phosphotransferase family protein [Burkholderiales bacterium]|nr:aminoglycoside phosphotransferase family protein [Burkholderiales bacterium]